MMSKAGWWTGSLLGAAMLMTGGAAAQTQPRYGYPNGSEPDYGESHDQTLDAEQEQEQEQETGSPKQSLPEEDFSDVAAADKQPVDETASQGASDEPTLNAEGREAQAMTDACALAARDEAERDGGYAEVRQMGSPRESRNGFIIDGDVEARSSWHAQDGRMRHFSCTVANGRIEDVYFQQERAVR